MKQKIKIVAMSDLHGTLPPSKTIPKCDLILIAGDICAHHSIMDQSVWLYKEFKPWLENLPTNKVIGVAGNHDWIWEKSSHMVPKLPWTYLQDNYCEYMGWKIYGSPWQKRFFDWAFNLDEPELERKWSYIPDDTDILVLHGPPQGFGDLVISSKRVEHTGSPSLLKKIEEVKPRLVVYGHIHPAFGVYEDRGITMANVSILNDHYIWTNLPTEFILDPDEKRTIAKIGTIVNRKDSNFKSRVIEWCDAEVTTS